jgi:hypothetical protein
MHVVIWGDHPFNDSSAFSDICYLSIVDAHTQKHDEQLKVLVYLVYNEREVTFMNSFMKRIPSLKIYKKQTKTALLASIVV